MILAVGALQSNVKKARTVQVPEAVGLYDIEMRLALNPHLSRV